MQTPSYELLVPGFDPTVCREINWKIHMEFFLGVFRDRQVTVNFSDHLYFYGNSFECKYRDISTHKEIKFLVDFGDSKDTNPIAGRYPFTLKTHVSSNNKIPNIIPFAPVSFYNWSRARGLQSKYSYTGQGTVILNNQRPYGNAFMRRTTVQSFLKKKFGNKVDTEYGLPQEVFWGRVKDCRVAVLVPGQRNDIFDRSHGELFFFGCPIISPPLDLYLGENTLIKGVHYIPCEENYSNLDKIIEGCYNNTSRLIEVGSHAKKFFTENLTPESIESRFLKAINGVG